MANKYPIQQETGDARISLENFIWLRRMHGPLSGAIHRITPTLLQSTLLFFDDGHVHEALGLECGNMGEKAQALKAIVQTIFLAGSKLEGSILATMSADDETKKRLKDGETICFIMRPSSKNILQLSSINSNGTKTMDLAIETIASDGDTFCLEPTED